MSCGVEVVSLYYDPYDSFIYHEDGRVYTDVSNFINNEKLRHLREVGGTEYIESDEDNVTYELVFPIPEDEILTLCYDAKNNILRAEYGQIMFNMFAYITPQTLMLFKQNKKDMIVPGKNGQTIELLYDHDKGDDTPYNHSNNNEYF